MVVFYIQNKGWFSDMIFLLFGPLSTVQAVVLFLKALCISVNLNMAGHHIHQSNQLWAVNLTTANLVAGTTLLGLFTNDFFPHCISRKRLGQEDAYNLNRDFMDNRSVLKSFLCHFIFLYYASRFIKKKKHSLRSLKSFFKWLC